MSKRQIQFLAALQRYWIESKWKASIWYICTTDIVKYSSSRYKQTLRICDILSPENITECELEVPMTWPAYLGIARFKGCGHDKITETSGETHTFCRQQRSCNSLPAGIMNHLMSDHKPINNTNSGMEIIFHHFTTSIDITNIAKRRRYYLQRKEC